MFTTIDYDSLNESEKDVLKKIFEKIFKESDPVAQNSLQANGGNLNLIDHQKYSPIRMALEYIFEEANRLNLAYTNEGQAISCHKNLIKQLYQAYHALHWYVIKNADRFDTHNKISQLFNALGITKEDGCARLLAMEDQSYTQFAIDYATKYQLNLAQIIAYTNKEKEEKLQARESQLLLREEVSLQSWAVHQQNLLYLESEEIRLGTLKTQLDVYYRQLQAKENSLARNKIIKKNKDQESQTNTDSQEISTQTSLKKAKTTKECAAQVLKNKITQDSSSQTSPRKTQDQIILTQNTEKKSQETQTKDKLESVSQELMAPTAIWLSSITVSLEDPGELKTLNDSNKLRQKQDGEDIEPYNEDFQQFDESDKLEAGSKEIQEQPKKNKKSKKISKECVKQSHNSRDLNGAKETKKDKTIVQDDQATSAAKQKVTPEDDFGLADNDKGLKAVRSGDIYQLKRLIDEKNYNIFIKSPNTGNTLLHEAVLKGHIGMAIFLVRHGVRPKSNNDDGNTALQCLDKANYNDKLSKEIRFFLERSESKKQAISDNFYIKYEQNTLNEDAIFLIENLSENIFTQEKIEKLLKIFLDNARKSQSPKQENITRKNIAICVALSNNPKILLAWHNLGNKINYQYLNQVTIPQTVIDHQNYDEEFLASIFELAFKDGAQPLVEELDKDLSKNPSYANSKIREKAKILFSQKSYIEYVKITFDEEVADIDKLKFLIRKNKELNFINHYHELSKKLDENQQKELKILAVKYNCQKILSYLIKPLDLDNKHEAESNKGGSIKKIKLKQLKSHFLSNPLSEQNIKNLRPLDYEQKLIIINDTILPFVENSDSAQNNQLLFLMLSHGDVECLKIMFELGINHNIYNKDSIDIFIILAESDNHLLSYESIIYLLEQFDGNLGNKDEVECILDLISEGECNPVFLKAWHDFQQKNISNEALAQASEFNKDMTIIKTCHLYNEQDFDDFLFAEDHEAMNNLINNLEDKKKIKILIEIAKYFEFEKFEKYLNHINKSLFKELSFKLFSILVLNEENDKKGGNSSVFINSKPLLGTTNIKKNLEFLLKNYQSTFFDSEILVNFINYAKAFSSPPNLSIIFDLASKESLNGSFDGKSPIHYAVESGKPEILQALLKNEKIDLSKENQDGYNALHLAIINKQRQMVKDLANKFYEIAESTGKEGALNEIYENIDKIKNVSWNHYLAIITAGSKIVQESEKKIANKVDEVLRINNESNKNPGYIKEELENYEEINKFSLLTYAVNQGILKDDPELLAFLINKIDSLLKKKGNYLINFIRYDGSTMLHTAVKENLKKNLDFLLTKKPDLKICDENGYTALHVAINTRNFELAIKLIEYATKNEIDLEKIRNSHGVGVISYLELKNTLHGTPSSLGASHQKNFYQQILDKIKEYKELVKLDEKNNSQLNIAIIENRVEEALELAEKTPLRILKQQNSDGDITLHLVAKHLMKCFTENKSNRVDELLKLIVDKTDKNYINSQNSDGNTPLHIALENILHKKECYQNELISLFLVNGAKLDIKNNKGQTPFEIALEIHRSEIDGNKGDLVIELIENSQGVNNLTELLEKFESDNDFTIEKELKDKIISINNKRLEVLSLVSGSSADSFATHPVPAIPNSLPTPSSTVTNQSYYTLTHQELIQEMNRGACQ